jgi:gluconolactonase
MSAVALATGLAWPEGPAVLCDGRVAFVETYGGRIGAWSPELGYHVLASTGGGPNAIALGVDGQLYVCQNGGVVGPWRASDQRAPSIERVGLDGRVETLVTEIDGIGLQAPNDLAFGRDGRLYFTDPGRFDPQAPDPGYVFAVGPDGAGEVIADVGPVYPNGIVAEPAGSIVWVESYTRAVRRWRPGREVEVLAVLAEGHIPDGLALAADGTLYVTTVTSGGIDIVGPDGGHTGFLSVGSVPTNCAFAENRLYVTDGGRTGESAGASHRGILWALELAVSGERVFRGAIAARS